MAISQVVAIKVDGNHYNTVPPNVKGSGAGGSGGSVAKANSTSLLDGVTVAGSDNSVFGSTVVTSDNVQTALNTGTLAYNNPAPIAKRVTTKLNVLDNNFLLSGALKPSLIQSIHKQLVLGMGYSDGVRTRYATSAIRGGYWNQYSGQFDSGYPVVGIDLFENDTASTPTRSVPGRLSYKTSSPNVINDTYKSKTG